MQLGSSLVLAQRLYRLDRNGLAVDLYAFGSERLGQIGLKLFVVGAVVYFGKSPLGVFIFQGILKR